MKTMLRYATLATAALSLCVPAVAQTGTGDPGHLTCRSNDLDLLAPLHQYRSDRLAEMAANEAALEAETQAFEAAAGEARGSNYVIPVVFHIIHNGGPENISNEQVEDAIRVLNDDFNKLNDDWDNVQAEFLPIVADVGITFRLAQLDPAGNCTNGITRTVSPLTNDGTQDMKDLIQWPRNKYLNIWVCAYANGAAGYTQNPGSVSNSWAAAADGIVVLHDYVGAIGTSSPLHSRTLTHEVGHWINLRHCWGPTNDPGLASNCGETDLVSDTPPTIGWTSCTLSGATCGSFQDNVENYMEYAYCSKMFTNGQKTRMLAALNSSTAQRNQLWTSSNLAATGTDGGTEILCAADFTSSSQVVCAGTPVTFSDLSYNGATQWSWDLPGATPSTSTDENPVVTYDTPGTYSVTLTAGNGITDVDLTRTNYITVLPTSGMPAPYAQNFDAGTSLPSGEFFVVNVDDDEAFQVTNTAGYSGSNSLRLRNHGNDVGDIDEIISNTIDLSGATQVTFSFRYAFARRNSDNSDVLRMYASYNCGETWNLRKQITAVGDLPTVPDQSSQFTPDAASDWQYVEITNLTSIFHVSDFRFKFWFEGGGGNNLYIDDINLNGSPVGIAEIPAGTGLSVVPNPSTGDGAVYFNAVGATNARIEVIDILGRPLAVLHDGPVASGTSRYALPTALPSGAYLVRATHEGVERMARFTVR